MILHALTQLFEDLVQRGEVSKPGWSPAKISYALRIDENGNLLQVIPQHLEENIGKKSVLLPQKLVLPAAVRRTTSILPNFLWDNSSYILGVDETENQERCLACFRASSTFHHELLEGVDSPIAATVLAFFDTWEPNQAKTNPVLSTCLENITNNANFVFQINDVFAQDDSAIQVAWDRHFYDAHGQEIQCLVTGNLDVAASVHPTIKGVVGAHTSGAAIVSFNAPAYCSYGKEQGLNAPIGRYAAFAYTAALNHLLSKRDNVQRFGDTTVVYWAEDALPQYNHLFRDYLFGTYASEHDTTGEWNSTILSLIHGSRCGNPSLDPNKRFYVLGLTPNAARLSIRFFCSNTFGELIHNIYMYHKRMEITGNFYRTTPLWALLMETVNTKSRDKEPSPLLTGAVIRAILTGTAYPALLMETIIMRIRADRMITPLRASIIKAYYLTRPNPQCPAEILTVRLNESSTNIPYTLGRLLSVYEIIHQLAFPRIKTTVKDKYLIAAFANPSNIFHVLDRLCKNYLLKINSGLREYYRKQIAQFYDKIKDVDLEALQLPEQGSFILGYYHQHWANVRKDEKSDESNKKPL